MISYRTIIIFVLAAALFGCSPAADSDRAEKKATGRDWKQIQLTDVNSNKKFRIADFRGRPVLLESFAVWCPTCKRQQDEIKKLHDEVGDQVVSISVDTDPEEDAQRVIGHVNKYDYDWRFAVDEGGFAKSLVEEFGVNVVNAPAAPVVLIDEDQKARLLSFGVKSAAELKKEIEAGAP